MKRLSFNWKQTNSWFYLIMQYRIHHLMNYKKFRCVLRLSDKDWRIWRLWLTISCLHSSTCESWSPPIYCWRSSSKHCQSSKHSGQVCHLWVRNHLRKCEDTYFILQNKYLCIYQDSFGAKILTDDCAHSGKCLRKINLGNSFIQ